MNSQLQQQVDAAVRQKLQAMGLFQESPPVGKETRDDITALAHCTDPLCEGYAQREIPAVLHTRSMTVGEMGGGASSSDLGAQMLQQVVETSWEYVHPKDPADAECPFCGRHCDISTQVRPSYRHIVGDQEALLRVQKEDRAGDATGLKVARLEGMVEALLAGKTVELPPEPEPAKLPEGVRMRGERFQARLNKSETPEGEAERILGSFGTLMEATEARIAALTEADDAAAA